MKNVVIFALGGQKFAVELRWVREIFPLGPVTPVPTAPPAVAGAMNFRGMIVTVLRAALIMETEGSSRAPRAGDAVILLDVDGVRAALAVDHVDEVTTIHASLADHHVFEDHKGRSVRIVDAGEVLARARRLVGEAAAGGHAPRA